MGESGVKVLLTPRGFIALPLVAGYKYKGRQLSWSAKHGNSKRESMRYVRHFYLTFVPLVGAEGRHSYYGLLL